MQISKIRLISVTLNYLIYIYNYMISIIEIRHSTTPLVKKKNSTFFQKSVFNLPHFISPRSFRSYNTNTRSLRSLHYTLQKFYPILCDLVHCVGGGWSFKGGGLSRKIFQNKLRRKLPLKLWCIIITIKIK